MPALLPRALSRRPDGLRRVVDAAGGARDEVRSHPIVASAVAAAAVAAGATGLVLRKLVGSSDLTPESLAAATAVSVWDAAKGAVIMDVREAGDAADVGVAARATRTAVLDAARSGADVTAAALGAVEGAISVASLLGVPTRDVASTTATAAIEAAREVGEGAAARVQRALHERFGSHSGR